MTRILLVTPALSFVAPSPAPSQVHVTRRLIERRMVRGVAIVLPIAGPADADLTLGHRGWRP